MEKNIYDTVNAESFEKYESNINARQKLVRLEEKNKTSFLSSNIFLSIINQYSYYSQHSGGILSVWIENTTQFIPNDG